jgi:zinc transporter
MLPLGFLTGLLGINVGGIPLAESPWGFPVICAILAAIVGAQVLLFRRLKWILWSGSNVWHSYVRSNH